MSTVILIAILIISMLTFALYTLYKNKKYMSLFLIIFSPYLGYQALLYSHYKAVLPSEIEVSFQFQLLKKGG